MAPRIRPILVLLLLSLLVGWSLGGSKDFFTRGEPREALAAQAMLATGEFVLPRVYGGDIPSKPPFSHWLMVLSSLPTGEVTELTARMPSLLASLVFIFLLYFFLRARVGVERALVTSLLLLSSLEWLRATGTSRVDMVLAVSFAAGLGALYRWQERGMEGLPILSILLFGAATLAKGPVALVVPGGIFALFLLSDGRPLALIFKKGLLVFVPAALLAGVWYLLGYLVGGQPFLDKVYYENVERFMGTMEDEPHKHSALYLYGTLLLGMMPWTIIMGASALAARPHWRWRPIAALMSCSRLSRYAIITSILFLFFFSIPSSKRSVYLLPIYPSLAFLLSGLLLSMRGKALGAAWWGLRALLLVLFVTGAVTTILLWGVVEPALFIKKASTLAQIGEVVSAIRADMTPLRAALLPMLALLPVAGFMASFGPFRSPQTLVGLCVIMVTSVLAFAGELVVSPIAASISARPISEQLRAILPESSGRLYSYGSEFYGISFYLKQSIERFSPHKLAPHDLILLYESDKESLAAEMPDHLDLVELARSERGVIKPTRHVVALSVRAKEGSASPGVAL